MRPVGYGARCVCCGERRRQVLRMVEFHSTWRSMCFNCAGQMYALIATPDTIEGLRKALRRERRRVERRADRTDTRVFRFERRVGERRDVLGDAMELLDDDLIIEVVPDLDVELGDDGDMDGEEHTRIHQNLAQLAEGLAQGSATALPAVDRFSADGNPAAHLGRMSRVARAERAEPESRQPYEPTIIVSVQ